MKGRNDPRRQIADEARAASVGVAPSDVEEGLPAKPRATEALNDLSSPPVDRSAASDQHGDPGPSSPPSVTVTPLETGPRPRSRRKWLLAAVVAVVFCIGGYVLTPSVLTALGTVSTDDAYVNGHVTFVAPRVAGQVSEVLVDDNYRVKKGDVLVELDSEPYRVQVAIKKAAVETAETDLSLAQAQVRAQVAQARAKRYQLEHAVEDVDNQIASLRANVATLEAKKAASARAQADFKRAEELLPTKAISQADYDQLKEARLVAEAQVKQAFENVYQTRVSLGLPASPPKGHDLTEVPPDLDQTFSAVRQALGELQQSAAQFGYFAPSWTATPKETIETFYKQDPEGNLDRIYARLIALAPAIKEAEAKLRQARCDLDDAELNLRYCKILSEIDGVVTARSVNPGNNVQVGQSLMAVRSLTEIWIDANFKETQLARLRIGQRVRCEVDMYGGRQEFEGRITGFTMGTGETLSLLPPQNATGNFVKIVQRLPVRIELTDYDADKVPLFVGLSVVPYVYYKEPPTGLFAGDYLQRITPVAQRSTPSRMVK